MIEKELRDLFWSWRKFHRVVVTGPQRSGTQIATEIIADCMEWQAIKEDRIARKFRLNDHDDRYFRWVNNPERQSTVLQCPRISHACHLTPKPTLVVFMMRDVADIIASDKHRISKYKQGGWAGPHRYGTPVQSVFNGKALQYSKLFYNHDEPLGRWEVPQAVYDVWNNIQTEYDFNYYELEYELLKVHPLWLSLKTRRELFQSGTQTSL